MLQGAPGDPDTINVGERSWQLDIAFYENANASLIAGVLSEQMGFIENVILGIHEASIS
jgi:hypothetical protein